MGSDNLMNSTNLTETTDKISSPVVKAIASHVGRYYPSEPKASTQPQVEDSTDKTVITKTCSVNNSVEIVFEEKHAPVGFENIFAESLVKAEV